MKHKIANSSNRAGQLKIQEMAFVIVGLVVFFGIVVMLVISISFSGVKESAQNAKDESARQLIRTLSSSPEFAWSESCASCIDKDKIFLLNKSIQNYTDFWKLDYLVIDTLYPNNTKSVECTGANYPNCGKITLLNTEYYGVPSEAYVSICYYNNGLKQCDLGKMYASVKREG